MLSQGHRRIGYLGSNHPIEDGPLRQQGYAQAMAAAGLATPDNWRAYGSPDLQGGEAAMVELLGRNLQLSAVFAYNDAMAAGAMAVLKENGITVPQHFSLIGFDDIPIARYTSPKLTTVRYPIVSMARWPPSWRCRAQRAGGAAGRSSVHADAGAAPFCRPGKVRRRSLSDDLILCNRFQSVRKFTEY